MSIKYKKGKSKRNKERNMKREKKIFTPEEKEARRAAAKLNKEKKIEKKLKEVKLREENRQKRAQAKVEALPQKKKLAKKRETERRIKREELSRRKEEFYNNHRAIDPFNPQLSSDPNDLNRLMKELSVKGSK